MSCDREAVRPLVGTAWAWEPHSPTAAALVEVTRVTWNGEEWWVTARALAVTGAYGSTAGGEYPNDLSRFWEACHRVSVNHGPAGYHPNAVRRGPPRPDEESGR